MNDNNQNNEKSCKHIVSIGSVGSLITHSRVFDYSASKAALF